MISVPVGTGEICFAYDIPCGDDIRLRRMNGYHISPKAMSSSGRKPNACVYFYHKGLIKYIGVMLKGKMEVLTDQETKEMIWRKGDTMFYKGGVADPDYCVLKFTAESGRYYCELKTESFTIE